MKLSFRLIFLLAAGLPGLVVNAYAAAPGVLNLVKPIVPPHAVFAVHDGKGALICENGFALQKNGSCCPDGTNNDLWPGVCTPIGTIDDQLFNFNDTAHYCPSADMFIVSDKNWKWFSCADRDSVAIYAAAKRSEGGKFCRDHGYAYLIKIKPWGAVGCIKAGDSQGDGCIEAGTCSFVGSR